MDKCRFVKVAVILHRCFGVYNGSFRQFCIFVHMDSIWSILLVFGWIILMNLGGKFVKRLLGNDESAQKSKSKPKPTQESGETTHEPTPEEIFKEIRRKLEEQRKKQVAMSRKEVLMDEPEKQVVYRQKEVMSAREKRSSGEFQEALAKARKTEHDAEQHHLEQKSILVEPEEEQYPEFDLDLRNAIIGSIILERPYS